MRSNRSCYASKAEPFGIAPSLRESALRNSGKDYLSFGLLRKVRKALPPVRVRGPCVATRRESLFPLRSNPKGSSSPLCGSGEAFLRNPFPLFPSGEASPFGISPERSPPGSLRCSYATTKLRRDAASLSLRELRNPSELRFR